MVFGHLTVPKDGTYLPSANKNDQLTIKRLSTNYIICGERLYRRSYVGIHLLCVTAKEAQQIIEKKLWATHECTNAITKDNETRVLLDYYGSRLCSSCLEVSSMPSP